MKEVLKLRLVTNPATIIIAETDLRLCLAKQTALHSAYLLLGYRT